MARFLRHTVDALRIAAVSRTVKTTGSLLFALLVVTPLVAQTPIPTFLAQESAVGPPSETTSSALGVSSVAGNGKDFLVATSEDNFAAGYALWLMLVDEDGRPLLPVSYKFPYQVGSVPAVSSDGHDFLAVWGALGGTEGVRIASDGALLDAQPIAIHANTRSQMTSHDTSGRRGAAWDGSQYVVLTNVERLVMDPLQISTTSVATRLSTSGQIIQNDIPVSCGTAIAAGNGISVLIGDGSGVSAQTMNAAGVLSDPVPISDTTVATTNAAIARGDDGFLVVWSESGSTAVRARHLDPAGRPDAPQFTVAAVSAVTLGSLGIAGTMAPDPVAWDGGAYRVAWIDANKQVLSERVSVSRVLDASPIKLAGGFDAALGSSSTGALLTWCASDATRARTTTDSVGNGQIVHRVANSQALASVAFRYEEPLIDWKDSSTSWLTDVATDTSFPPLVGSAYTLVPGLQRPLVVTGSTAPFPVRYADGFGAPFALPTSNPFWTGSSFLCIWTDLSPDTDSFRLMPLWAQRFDANGTPIDRAPRQIATSLSLQRSYAGSAALTNGVFVGSSATEVLVVHADPLGAIRGVLLNGDRIIDIGQIAPPEALTNPVDVTSDGTDFLVTWINGARGTNAYISSRLVLANGDMPDPWRGDSLGNDTKDAMATFWTGQNYLVLWSKVVSAAREIWALRIDRSGKLLDFPPQKIGSIDGSRAQWAYKDGRVVMAYERDGRVYWRWIVTPRRRVTVHG